MSAHCDDCGADLVYGTGDDWQLMTCPRCELADAIRDILDVSTGTHCRPMTPVEALATITSRANKALGQTGV